MSTSFSRSPSTGHWVKARDIGGTCFTISLDRFEEILKTGKLPAAFSNWKLKDGEFVERFRFEDSGDVTIFIGNR